MVPTLAEMRQSWEKGITLLHYKTLDGVGLAVLYIGGGKGYRCHRYYNQRGRWEMSVDRDGVDEAAAMEWLNEDGKK